MKKYWHKHSRRFLSFIMALALMFSVSATCFASAAELSSEQKSTDNSNLQNVVLYVYRFEITSSSSRYNVSERCSITDAEGTEDLGALIFTTVYSKSMTRNLSISGSVGASLTTDMENAIDAKVVASLSAGVTLSSTTNIQRTYYPDSSKGSWCYIEFVPRVLDVKGILHTDAYINGIYVQDVLTNEIAATYPEKFSDGSLAGSRKLEYTNDRSEVPPPG